MWRLKKEFSMQSHQVPVNEAEGALAQHLSERGASDDTTDYNLNEANSQHGFLAPGTQG